MKITSIPDFTCEDFVETDKPYKFVYEIEDSFEKEQVRVLLAARAHELRDWLGEDFPHLMRAYEDKRYCEKKEAEEKERLRQMEMWVETERKRDAEKFYEEAKENYTKSCANRRESEELLEKAKKAKKLIFISAGITLGCAIVNILCLVM